MVEFTCWECGMEMKEGVWEFEDEVNGEEFKVKTKGIKCEGCGYQTVASSQMDSYNIAFADAYRKKHELLTTEELLHYRNEVLKMSQQAFADYIGVHVQSVKKWEHGCVQKESTDRNIRNKVNEYRNKNENKYSREIVHGSCRQVFTIPFEFDWRLINDNYKTYDIKIEKEKEQKNAFSSAA